MPLLTIPTGNVASAIGGGYEVANSCRFDGSSDNYMHKTPSGAGNRRTFTISTWVKRCDPGNHRVIMAVGSGGARDMLLFESSDKLQFSRYDSSYIYHIKTNRLFRDPSAWYHICVTVDTTQGTDTNRIKLYINGTQETSLDTSSYPTQNLDTDWNSTQQIRVGVDTDDNAEYNGYMAEVVMIDGSALAPTSFGEFDEDSPTIWKPKDVSGLTFGTNGFYLDFEDSSNLGNDANGGTDLTEVNLAATDQATDTCTNNFATLNPLYNQYADPTFSEGNLKITVGSGWSGAKGTMGVSKGKWFWELKLTGTMSSHQHGVQQENVNENAQNPQNTTGSTSFYNHDGGEMNTDGSNTSADYGTFSSGEIMGVALNMDGGSYGQITIYKNGSAIVSNFNLASSSTLVMPHASIDNSTAEYNFGSPPYSESGGNSDGNGYGNFSMTVPSGYFCLNTKNLAEYG